MAIQTPQQRKKRNLLLFGIASVLILAAAAVFLVGSGNLDLGGGDTELSSETKQRVDDILRSVAIPQSFFENDVLGQYVPYSPITSPSEFGRENPFEQF